MRSIFLTLLFTCFLSQSAVAGGNAEAEHKAKFKTLSRGYFSGYRIKTKEDSSKQGVKLSAPAQDEEFLVIDNEGTFQAFWKAHSGGGSYIPSGLRPKAKIDPSVPKVDFKKSVVIAVFAGPRIVDLEQINKFKAELEARQKAEAAHSDDHGHHDHHHSAYGIEIRDTKLSKKDLLTVFYSDHTKGVKTKTDDIVLVNPFHIVTVDRIEGRIEFSSAVKHHVPPSTTAIFGLILIAMVLCLALEEKLHAKKSIITGSFAVISLLAGGYFGILPFGPISNTAGEYLNVPVYITAVDWEVIGIILASSIFVDATSKSGIFTWIAIKLTKKSKGDPLMLLVFYGSLTVIFSAVLNNVTAMIIIGSLTGVSLKKLNKNELLLGFLLIEGLLTNVGGLLTLISSVPNIIVGNTAGISFFEFFVKAAPYVILTTMVTLALGSKIYGIESFKSEEERQHGASQVSGFDENDGIKSQSFFNFSAFIFVLFIIVLASSSAIPVLSDLKMAYVAAAFATVMLLLFRHDVDKFYAKVDWDLIAFFASLFMVINVMEHAQVLEQIGVVIAKLLALGQNTGSAALLAAAAVASSVTDNIPLAAMLAKILGNQGLAPESGFWWSVIFGANLGGNITPIGSASTVVAVTVMSKYNVKLSFLGFVKAAAIFAVVQIAIAIVYVLLLPYILILWVLSLIALGACVFQLLNGSGGSQDEKN